MAAQHDKVTPAESLAQEVRAHENYYRVTGIVAIIAGLIAILMPHVATVAASVVIGALFVVTGIAASATAFSARKLGRIAMGFFVGLLFVIAGAFLLIDPTGGAVALTLVLTAFLLVSGLLKLYFGWRLWPDSGAGWAVTGGALSVVLGSLIWSGMPGTGFWVLGLFVGIDLIFYGISLLALLSAARSGA